MIAGGGQRFFHQVVARDVERVGLAQRGGAFGAGLRFGVQPLAPARQPRRGGGRVVEELSQCLVLAFGGVGQPAPGQGVVGVLARQQRQPVFGQFLVDVLRLA